jgi:hypothetical protein
MFSQNKPTSEPTPQNDDTKTMLKYKQFISAHEETANTTMDHIDKLLETEKKNMSAEPWNKLDKRLKIQKLHAYAEKYGKENGLPMKEIKGLKTFFSECLAKDKMSKVKEVEYNKATGQIINIPGLMFNGTTRAFTLKSLDKKVSTLKSTTPKNVLIINEVDDNSNAI